MSAARRLLARVGRRLLGGSGSADPPPPSGSGPWIHIVSYEDPRAWILGKIALRLEAELRLLGVRVDLGRTPDPRADINHHVCYWSYDGRSNGIDTMMVTHIDTDDEFRKLEGQLAAAQMGICMSSTEARRLVQLGLPAQKLCFVLPGHEGQIAARKLVIGITTRLYEDGRKREQMILDLARRMDLGNFKFAIMGSGWHKVVETLRGLGVEVEYHEQFDRTRYVELIRGIDYYLYAGMDEGSMGFIDALAAGVPTIVTPQGFHLDAPGGITHPFTTLDDLERIFRAIAGERNARVSTVAEWTFAHNARKHLRIWEFLLERRAGRPVDAALAAELAGMGLIA